MKVQLAHLLLLMFARPQLFISRFYCENCTNEDYFKRNFLVSGSLFKKP